MSRAWEAAGPAAHLASPKERWELMATTHSTARASDGTGGARPRSRRLGGVVLGVAVASLLGSTVQAATPSGAPSSDGAGQPVLGYSSTFLTDPFQALELKNSEREAAAQGATMLPAATANGDVSQQATDILNLITAGAQGLIVSVQDPRAVAPSLASAQEAGVPVISIGTSINDFPITFSVVADNVAMGKVACEAMGATVGGQGTVLSLQGALTSDAGKERSQGFADCMRDQFPNIKLVEKPTEWDAQKAADQAQTALVSEPELVGLYLQSDSAMLASVLAVLKSADRLVPAGEPGHLAIYTIDGTAQVHDAIRAGEVDGAVSQPLDQFAKYAVQYALMAIAGQALPGEGPTDHGSNVVKLGVNLVDMLASPLVTKDNVDDPSLWGNGEASN